MPVVTVDLWEGRSREQKKKLAEALTRDMVEIAKTKAEHVTIIFRDVKKSDWATAGKLSDEK